MCKENEKNNRSTFNLRFSTWNRLFDRQLQQPARLTEQSLSMSNVCLYVRIHTRNYSRLPYTRMYVASSKAAERAQTSTMASSGKSDGLVSKYKAYIQS